MKRSNMRRISKKLAKEQREYSTLRKKFLVANPSCQVCKLEGWKPRKATDIHHMERRGSNLNNTDTWLAVSRYAHDLIEFGSNMLLPENCSYLEEFRAYLQEIKPFHDHSTLTYGSDWARFRNYLK